jgi:hypothetical protein
LRKVADSQAIGDFRNCVIARYDPHALATV